MWELWKRVEPSLDRESLEWFSGATTQAESISISLQEVVEGVASLVSSDGSTVDRMGSGCFQSSHDVPVLLFAIANGMDNSRALSLVGEAASIRLSYLSPNKQSALPSTGLFFLAGWEAMRH